MRMREEVDALRTMGFDPIEVLILPRILALVIAVPILTFLGSMAALYGGGLVSLALRRHPAGSISCRACVKRSRADVRSRHDQGAVHGAGHRRCRLRRRLAGARAAPNRSASRPPIRWSNRSSSSSCSMAFSPCSSRRSECERWRRHRRIRHRCARSGCRPEGAPRFSMASLSMCIAARFSASSARPARASRCSLRTILGLLPKQRGHDRSLRRRSR